MRFVCSVMSFLAFVVGCGPAQVPPAERPAAAPAPLPVQPQSARLQVGSVESPTVAQPKLASCERSTGARDARQFLKGQLHIHSERSFDAANPVPDIITFFAEREYDFLSITDHNHITIPQEYASDMLVVPGVELTYNATVCNPPPHPGYLCAFHTSVLFLNPMLDTTRGRHFILPFRRHRHDVFRVLMRRADDLEGLTVLNHPTYHFAVSATLLDRLLIDGVRFVEFFNGGVLDRSKDGPLAEIEKAEQLWDVMLDRGHQVFAVGGDDAHHFADAATVRMTGRKPLVGDRVWIMVRAAKALGPIRKAMTEGDFYVSTGVHLSHLETSPAHVHVTVAPTRGESYVTRFVGGGGHILARVEGEDACYPLTGSEAYVRAVVESDKGTYAWTQPLMLGGKPDLKSFPPAVIEPELETPTLPPQPSERELPTVW